jgi:hypothetical protein
MPRTVVTAQFLNDDGTGYLMDIGTSINASSKFILPPDLADTEITTRTIVLSSSDGGQFVLSYPVPFDETLSNYLTNSVNVVAFELIGEKLKYGRLRKLLDNV